MHQVMRQPAAQRRYRIRQASVEPVYSVMRYRGFTRFRRRGRAGATTEFALHCIAYNLERAVHIGRRTVALVAHLARRAAAPWRFLAVWLVSLPSAATA